MLPITTEITNINTPYNFDSVQIEQLEDDKHGGYEYRINFFNMGQFIGHSSIIVYEDENLKQRVKEHILGYEFQDAFKPNEINRKKAIVEIGQEW